MTLKETELAVKYILFTEGIKPRWFYECVLLALEDFSHWSYVEFPLKDPRYLKLWNLYQTLNHDR